MFLNHITYFQTKKLQTFYYELLPEKR